MKVIRTEAKQIDIFKEAPHILFLRFLRYCCFVSAMSTFLVGCLFTQYGVMVIGAMLLLCSNIFYAFEKIRARIIFLIFNITFFTFLLARPFVRLLQGKEWWLEFTETGIHFSLLAVFLGLAALQVGAILCDQILLRAKLRPKRIFSGNSEKRRQDFLLYLQSFALGLFYLTMAAYLYIEFDKLIFMQGKAYEDYYILYHSNAPFPIGTLAAMMPYSFCLFLATYPEKKKTFLPLVLYLLSSVPMLLIGIRNHIVLNSIFIFLYYFMRDSINSKEKWLGKTEKLLLAVIVPLALIGLAAYNYIRAGTQVVQTSFWDLFLDFLDKQGVSFKTLCLGYDALPSMPKGMRFYTFGPFIEYLFYGSLGQHLLGMPDLGVGNNAFRALNGHLFAHSMSYATRTDYLQGHGWGSSYLIEAYADFGWVGLVVFGIFIGIALILLMQMFSQGWLARTISLVCLTELFFVPRAETTGWLLFLAEPHFWLVLIFGYVMAQPCAVSYPLKNRKLCTNFFSFKNKQERKSFYV